jgi:DNA polymerase-3 subunit delta
MAEIKANSAAQIMLDLKRRIFKPIYFLSGEEPYYIDEISDHIENHVLEESEREFNQSVVYGKDVDLGAVLGMAKQYPMMSEYHVVIVKEAQNMKELNKSAGAEEEEEPAKPGANNSVPLFLNYINKPLSSTILVFCYKYKKLDKRSSLAKALQKSSVFFESPRLYDNKLPEWIGNYVKERNYGIAPKASFLLSEFLGNDLSKIANEINKLFIRLPEGTEITAEMVQDKIGISKDFNVFELQEALGKKDVLKANRIVNHFAANEKDNPPQLVLASLFGYFSKILRYHHVPDKSKFAAAQALGVNPFFVDSYASAAQLYNLPKLRLVFSYLKETDLKAKGVDNPSIAYGELLKELVYKILH